MDDARITRIEASFAKVAPHGHLIVKRFYERLFADHPTVRPLFPTNLAEQEGKLLASIALVISSLRTWDGVVPILHELGQRHVGYGAIPAYYGAVSDALLATLAEVAADAWTPQLHDDWADALNHVAQAMLTGSERANP